MRKVPLFLSSLLCCPGWSWAQAAVADPAAPVPAVVYRSVFSDPPAGVETGALDWKAANTEVGQFRNGHIDILKWEAAQARQKVAAPMPAPAAAPASGAAKP